VTGAAAFAAILLWALAPAGKDAPEIAIVVDRGDEPWALDVREDSRLVGFTLRLVRKPWEGEDPRRLVALARELGALACVRVVRGPSAAEIWIADRLTDKTVLRAIAAEDLRGPDGEALLALRVVELLRGSFLETSLPGPARPAESPAVRRLVPELRGPGRLDLRSGLGVVASPGGLSSALLAVVSLGVRVSGETSLSAGFGTSVSPARVRAPGAAARLEPLLASLTVRRAFGAPTAPLRPALSAGAAAVWLRGRGTAAAPASGHEDSAWVGAPFLGGALAFFPRPWLVIAVDAAIGATLPQATVRFADAAVARWGAPFILLGAQVGVVSW
jgi:hypothetical protein